MVLELKQSILYYLYEFQFLKNFFIYKLYYFYLLIILRFININLICFYFIIFFLYGNGIFFKNSISYKILLFYWIWSNRFYVYYMIFNSWRILFTNNIIFIYYLLFININLKYFYNYFFICAISSRIQIHIKFYYSIEFEAIDFMLIIWFSILQEFYIFLSTNYIIFFLLK